MFNAELTSQLYSHFKHQQQQQQHQQQKKRRPQSVTSEEDEEEYEEEELGIDLKEADTATDGEQQVTALGDRLAALRGHGLDPLGREQLAAMVALELQNVPAGQGWAAGLPSGRHHLCCGHAHWLTPSAAVIAVTALYNCTKSSIRPRHLRTRPHHTE